MFKLKSNYSPAGHQPDAIKKLTSGIESGLKNQVLLGVTGSGKTFTIANVIQNIQKPTLVMAHNKTLAAQLYAEMKEFFPENAVEYFVSYYDYYQPEAYIAKTDTYIEKDSAINEQIDLLRHSATRSLVSRRDVIVVSSVSCIYGIGSPDIYGNMRLEVKVGESFSQQNVLNTLVSLQYKRNDVNFVRGTFRVKGDVVDIFPAYFEEKGVRIEFFGKSVDAIYEFDTLTGRKISSMDRVEIFSSSHHVTTKSIVNEVMPLIKEEMKQRVAYFESIDKAVEAQRVKQRVDYDMEMLLETGSCKGIENYSRYMTGRQAGQPPPTLFEYLPQDSLLVVDESHVSVPQIGGMYAGDRSRKMNLVEYGFRLVSALDNRPLKFEEWQTLRPQTIFVSATPGQFEVDLVGGEVVEQVIRPTGLLDPECFVRPIVNQVDDVISEIKSVKETLGLRSIVTTLTKKMAEDLDGYLREIGVNSTYLHSDIDTIERINIIQQLRRGSVDVVVGVNLLREGLDIPECGFVAIMDADKEGFLRSQSALIQTIGRAARNSQSKVVLYADKITRSMDVALKETSRRREIQMKHNLEHSITPTTVMKPISKEFDDNITANKKRRAGSKTRGSLSAENEYESLDVANILPSELDVCFKEIKNKMLKAADDLDFERAAQYREVLKRLQIKKLELELS